MFPRQKGFYFPKPSRFNRIKKSNDNTWLYTPSVHDPETTEVLSSHLAQSLATLRRSYEHVYNDLLSIMPDLLITSDLKVMPFPQLKLPLVGTLVEKSPVSGVKKLQNIKQDCPTLGALSYSLLDDLIAGNDEALFKKIDRLQASKHSLFSEFFYFLNSDWDLVSDRHFKKYNSFLAGEAVFKDQHGFFDCKKYEEQFHDLDFLADCVIGLVCGTHVQQLYPIYGLGLRLVLEGRIDVLTYLLNDKLHPFDAMFLKFVLPNFIRVAFVGSDSDLSMSYFIWMANALSNLNDQNYSNTKEFALLPMFYKSLLESYCFTIVVPGLTTTPKLGENCLVHFFSIESPNPKPKKKMSFGFPKIFSTYDPYVLDHVNTFSYIANDYKLEDNDSPQGMFETPLLSPLMVYLMNLLIQAPVGKLVKHQGRLGPILRAIFPGFRIDLLSLPLNDSERTVAAHLLRTQAHTALYSSLQGYHLAQLMDSPSVVVDGVYLFMEGFLNLSKKAQTKGRVIYQGSNDGYTVNTLGANVKPGVAEQRREMISTYTLWARTFGFFEELHPQYENIKNAPYCRAETLYGEGEYSFLLTPNTPSLKHSKNGKRFYPVVFNDKGLYCHLDEGAHLPARVDQGVQYIASGCCLLGNDFVATVESDNGRLSYHPLDAHHEVPAGTFVDFAYKHQEHPEETMYLAIQKTLAPFYRDTNPVQRVIFYYHDLRNNYLFYLLPHYIKGTLSRELLLKGMAMIDARHQLMMTKLTAIFSPYDIDCRAYSSFNSLDRECLLDEIDHLRQTQSVEETESALAHFVLNVLATDSNSSEESRRVYAFIQAQKGRYEELLKQQGLRSLVIVDYMAQFAIINQWAKSPLWVALPSIEYKLLTNYEFLFAQAFGSVIHFLWMNPINLRDDQKHNRLFFIDKDIPEYCELIEKTAGPIQHLIRQQSLDNPFGVAKAMDALKLELSKLPHFFAKPKALPQSDNVNQLDSANDCR